MFVAEGFQVLSERSGLLVTLSTVANEYCGHDQELKRASYIMEGDVVES